MNALQPRPSLYPAESARRQSSRLKRKLRKRRNPHQTAAIESGIRLTVNIVVGMVAIASIARLLPQNIAQQQRLNALQSDVASLEVRVNQLQENFARQFDAGQMRSMMQEETGRIGVGQRPVIWVNTAEAEGATPSQPQAGVAGSSASATAVTPSVMQPSAPVQGFVEMPPDTTPGPAEMAPDTMPVPTAAGAPADTTTW